VISFGIFGRNKTVESASKANHSRAQQVTLWVKGDIEQHRRAFRFLPMHVARMHLSLVVCFGSVSAMVCLGHRLDLCVV